MKIVENILNKITDHLPARVISDGDNPYLERYYVCTMLGWRFYIHKFVASDPDKGLHDHPWTRAFSIVLSGWYEEQTRTGTRKVKWFNILNGDTFHRVLLPQSLYISSSFYDDPEAHRNYQPCFTLFGHRVGRAKTWGFLRPMSAEYIVPLTKHEALSGTQIFTPYDYSNEGGTRPTEWWKTAPKGKFFRDQSQQKTN